MASLLKSPWLWIMALALGLVVGALWVVTAYYRGELQASRDHQRGHFEVRWGGKRAAWHREFEKLLQRRYGVKVNYLGMSVASLEEDWYSDGYNTTSRRLLVARYGKNIFRECKRHAREQHARLSQR